MFTHNVAAVSEAVRFNVCGPLARLRCDAPPALAPGPLDAEGLGQAGLLFRFHHRPRGPLPSFSNRFFTPGRRSRSVAGAAPAASPGAGASSVTLLPLTVKPM